MPTPRTSKILLLVLFALLLTGCQEFRGPAWSPDGKFIAYTVYSRGSPKTGMDSSLYLLDPDDEAALPRLVAAKAGFPVWSTDSQTCYYLGSRDDNGFFTQLLKFTPGEDKPAAALDNVRATSMQMALVKGLPVFLIEQGRDARPGAAVRCLLWNPADNKRTDLGNLGEIFGPALSYNGRLILYGTKPAAGHAILMAAELGGAEPKAIFPTADIGEPDATSFVVHPFPDTERFLFYAPGSGYVWTMDGKPGSNKFTRFTLPQGTSTPVMARIADDSNFAYLTLLRPTTGHLQYESYQLDLKARKWNKLDGDPDTLVGGQTADPRARKTGIARSAWLSPAGLALGDAKQPRWLPVTSNELLAASRLYLKAGQTDKALEMATRAQEAKPASDPEVVDDALYAAYIANKNLDRAAGTYEQSRLLAPITPSGIRYVFARDSGLMPAPPDWFGAETRKLDELVAAQPDNRMLPLLKDALLNRQKGDHAKAVDDYKRAFDLCPDKARAAGTRFMQGVCELEGGGAYQAADDWESVARIEDFPQADLAGGLSALAYLLNGKNDSAVKAAAVLQLPAVKKSPLNTELSQAGALVKGKAFREHGVTKEALSADGATHVWSEFDSYWIPWASTRPSPLPGPDGKLTERHIGVKNVIASAIWTNQSPTPIYRFARAGTPPKLSPSGALIAFTVSGEVFPVADTFCDLLVLDLKGNVVSGNTQAATTGKTRGRRIITAFEWSSEFEVKLSGVEIDILGGKKPFEKAVPIGRHGALQATAE